MSKAVGKQVLGARMRMEQQAYTYTAEVVAATSQTAGSRQGMACFVEKCPPSGRWLNFLEQRVSLPSYLRREVTTAGGQRQHTMSYPVQLDEARCGGSP